jgi:hypothetical protein
VRESAAPNRVRGAVSIDRALRLGLASLIAVTAVGVFAGCGGGGGSKPLNPYANEINPNKTVAHQHGVDPDQFAEGSNDANFVIRSTGNNHYELRVTNTSDVGFINSFTWLAPPQMTITSVTGSSRGSCQLADKNIFCGSVAIQPPKCTCESGGKMTVRFVATIGDAKFNREHGIVGGLAGSFLRLGEMTPVPYVIPSYRGQPPVDLPICAKGQQSTKAEPCVHSGV